MKKLIFCDVDGTILDGSRGMNHISEKTAHAIRELSRDHYVLIASGRCRGLMDEEITSLNPSGYVLCNGAYAEVHGKPIFAQYFSDQTIRKIKEVTVAHKGFYILEALDDMYVDSLSSETFLEFMHRWGSSMSGFKEEKDSPGKYLISMIGFPERDILNAAKKELETYVDLADHKMYPSCDVNVKGINKSSGVKKVIEYLGIPLEDTYCFGDGVNDLEMLQSVGHPVIVANCMPALKGRGFEETDDVLEDGFYNYLLANKLIKAI